MKGGEHMERFINRTLIVICSFSMGGILMKFLYAMWLCNLYIKQVESITQGAVIRGWIL